MKDAERRDRERWTAMAEELAGLGYWRYDLRTRVARWSPYMYRIYGFDPGVPNPDHAALDRIHPDDRAEADARLAAAAAGEPGVTRTRVVWPDGTVRHTEGRIACERDEMGEVVAIFGAVLDVTDRRIEQDALARHESHLQILADNGGDIIIELGADLSVRWISPAIRRYGYEPDALTGRPVTDLLHAEDAPELREAALALARGGQTPERGKVYRLLAADGRQVWVESSATLIHAPDGAVEGAISVVRDITERRAAAQALAEREAQLRIISEHTRDVVIQYDLARTILYVSPAVRRYGYDPEDLIGRAASELVHPDDEAKIGAIVQDLFATGVVEPHRDHSHRVRAKSGDYVWMEGRPVIVRDENGRPLSVVSLLHDITERRAATEALAESERRYRLLTDNANDVIACYDHGGVFTFLSPAVLDLVGYAPEELVGRRCTGFMHPDDVGPVMEIFARHLAAGPGAPPIRFEYRACRKDGSLVWLEAHPRAIYDPDGRFLEFQDAVRDVTDRHRLEHELREARDAAEAAAAAKSEFLANMSHEIRTPLTAVLGYASLLAGRTDLDPAAQDHAARIASAGRGLLALVNDVLDFSKLEAGHVEVRRVPTDLAALAGEMLDMAAFQAGAKGLELGLDAAPGLPACLSLDPKLVSQVLINLVGNGVKFTDTGGVTLALDYDPAAERLAVSVRDTGAGLTAEQSQRLFQRFSQVDGSATRRHGGTGLGLAICKGLVEAMGGTIDVESAPGAGACFRFVIPAPVAEPARSPEGEGEAFDPCGVRLLVIDDNPVNCELVSALLTPLGVEVTMADGGAAGLERAAEQPFDLILTDIRMPDLDGHQVLARLRAQDGPNVDAPILAFSADIDVRGESALEFDGHVCKPLEPGALIQAIIRWTAPWVSDVVEDAHAA